MHQWEKGLETRMGEAEAVTSVNNEDGVGDGYTRITSGSQILICNLVNGATPTGRVVMGSLLPKIYGDAAVTFEVWKAADPEPDDPHRPIAGLLDAALEYDQTELGTQPFNIAIYDSEDTKLDEIQCFSLVQDNLGIGAPPP